MIELVVDTSRELHLDLCERNLSRGLESGDEGAFYWIVLYELLALTQRDLARPAMHFFRVAAIAIVVASPIMAGRLMLAVTLAGLHGAARLQRHSRRLLDGEIIDRCSSLARSLRIVRQVSVAVCDRLAGSLAPA